MKVTLNSKKTVKDRPYPKLMVSTVGIIVLMRESGKGTCLESGESVYEVGHASDYWDMDKFTDFEGSLTIENDERF